MCNHVLKYWCNFTRFYFWIKSKLLSDLILKIAIHCRFFATKMSITYVDLGHLEQIGRIGNIWIAFEMGISFQQSIWNGFDTFKTLFNHKILNQNWGETWSFPPLSLTKSCQIASRKETYIRLCICLPNLNEVIKKIKI